MKRLLTIVCMVASVLGMASLTAGTAMAQPAEPPSAPSPGGSPHVGPSRIAVIVFQQAVAQTNEGQRNFAQLREKFAPEQAKLKTESDAITNLKNQLKADSSTLSDLDRSAKLRSIDDKTKALQREAEDDQQDFNSQMQDVYQALAQKVYKVLDSYAKSHGYTMVLDASNQQTSPVLWVTPSDDITKAVVEAYNRQSGVPAQPHSASTPEIPSAPHITHPIRRPVAK